MKARARLPALAAALGLGWALTLAPPAASQVYRCGNSYGSAPCAGGRAVDTRPPMSVHGASGGDTRSLFLCQGYQGGPPFWSTEHCIRRRDSTLVREVRVPRHMRFEDQVKLASGQHQQAEALQRAPPRPAPAAPPGGKDASACAGFQQALRDNESAARVGGSAAWMDTLTQQRHRIIAAQRAAGC